MGKPDLRERLVSFAVDTIKFLGTISYKKEYEVFRYQLSKAAGSIGANYEESQASTPKEFHAKVSICLREARETNFWYRVIDKLKLGDENMRKCLIQESKEITLIMGSIESKTK
ncbi:MAG: four helix bundle protein [Candidatus Anammoxibacter sp.]